MAENSAPDAPLSPSRRRFLLGAGATAIVTLRIEKSCLDFSGRVRVEEGEMVLHTGQALSPEVDWTLAGGMLSVAGGAQSSDHSLHVSGASKLQVGGGSLAFDDSSSVDWPGSLEVKLSSDNALRFGTNAHGLSSGQLSRIRFADHPEARAVLDANGCLLRQG